MIRLGSGDSCGILAIFWCMCGVISMEQPRWKAMIIQGGKQSVLKKREKRLSRRSIYCKNNQVLFHLS